jgi:hypothetical protein
MRLHALAWGVEVPSGSHRVRRNADALPFVVDFWPSLGVEILGGIATGLVLAFVAGGVAAWRSYHRHDAALRDLRDETRR